MRKWTHEVKNTLSEKIDYEIEQRHRKEKESRIKTDKAQPIVQIEVAEI